MKEVEFLQRTLLKALLEEKEKSEAKQNKSIINQLSKTIADNSNLLDDFGIAPPFVSKIKDVISMNYINNNANFLII
jgi:hypothetical protein